MEVFTRRDLVTFGEYLLSAKRRKRYAKHKMPIPLEVRLSSVNHADVENWKEEQQSGKLEQSKN